MAQISILVVPDPFGLGLSDFVIFNKEFHSELYGVKGCERYLRGIEVEGEIDIGDDSITIKVDWAKNGIFISHDKIYIINVGGKNFWTNPTCCDKCMRFNGKPAKGNPGTMQ